MVKWTGMMLCAVALAACTSAEGRILFDGQFYNAKLRKVDRQIDVFTVTVRPVSKSLTGALAAGEHEAISHCVTQFGSSDILWTAGPDVPEGQLNIQDDTLTLQGRCPNAR